MRHFYAIKIIDDEEFKDVYLIPDNTDTLYYSTQTGLIKLIYPEGEINFD